MKVIYSDLSYEDKVQIANIGIAKSINNEWCLPPHVGARYEMKLRTIDGEYDEREFIEIVNSLLENIS